jgi:hypothetical protein
MSKDFQARCNAIDKTLTANNNSTVLMPRFDELITTYSPPIQGSTTSTQGLPPSTPSSTPSLTQGSMVSKQSFNNFFTNVIAQSCDHQDLHAPTMGVTMSAMDKLTLKSMVQTINNILIAYARGRNLSHARMRATYTLRERVIHHMSCVRIF